MKQLSDKVDEKLRKREERYDRERRFRIKSSEDLETLEEVFDKRTLLTILKILNIGKLKEITGVLKAGKESRVYHGLDPTGKEVAVKIFLTSSNIFRQGRLKYIQGDPRFKDIPHDTRTLVDMWALKEYKNLELAGQAIKVPAPTYVEKNVILLEFIGSDGKSAPHLRDVPLEAPAGWYKKTLEMLKDLHDKVKLVHGDLSEYNILVPDGYPVFIDFAQAVTMEHPEAKVFLRRDVENLNHYFGGLGVKTRPFEKVFPEIE